MAVDSVHDEYRKALPKWEMIDDIVEGEDAVKEAGTKYVPSLGGQTPGEYSAYIQRGNFFNAYSRTLQGLIGYVFRKEAETVIPPQIEKIKSSLMSTGQALKDLDEIVATMIFKYGRAGLLTDVDAKGLPYVAVYSPHAIINWKTTFVDGREVLTRLVLKETVTAQDPKDRFNDVVIDRYRVFELRDGVVVVSVWTKQEATGTWLSTNEIIPTIKNKALTEIKFNIIGSEANLMQVNKPPLIDLAYANVAHWRLSVDYNHGLHYCALPTPWAAGFPTKEDNELSIGPVHAWISPDPAARCGYLEFTGTGLAAISTARSECKDEMAILGARIIEQTRAKVETAETAKIRQSSESGAIVTIVNNISTGLTRTLKHIADFLSIEVPVEQNYTRLSTDFIDTSITPHEVVALLSVLQAGKMSLDTFLHNLKQGEILPEGRSIDDEKDLIDEDMKRAALNMLPVPEKPNKSKKVSQTETVGGIRTGSSVAADYSTYNR